MLLVCSLAVFGQAKTVKLSGKLLNYNNQVTLYDVSEYGRLLPQSHNISMIPDSAGNFSATFKLDKPGYFVLGRNYLYLSPGDRLVITADAKKGAGATTFTGIGAGANNYLCNNQATNMGGYVYGGTNLKQVPEDNVKFIVRKAADRQAELRQLKDISPEFRRLEEARIKADIVVSLIYVPIYAKFTKTIANKDSFITAFNPLAEPLKKKYLGELGDPSLISLNTYRDILSSVIGNAPATANTAPLKDFQRASSISGKIVAEHDKIKLAAFETSIDSLTNPGYKKALKAFLKELMRFGVGDLAVDFKGIDINGKAVKLSDLKGKVIFVDLWATWCGPCLHEMPALEVLKEKYKNDARIVFLSLSIDEAASIEAWKKNVADRHADGYQWHADPNVLTPYAISAIPRMILIDKDFRVVNMSAPLPSQPGAVAAIDALLK